MKQKKHKKLSVKTFKYTNIEDLVDDFENQIEKEQIKVIKKTVFNNRNQKDE